MYNARWGGTAKAKQGGERASIMERGQKEEEKETENKSVYTGRRTQRQNAVVVREKERGRDRCEAR